MCKQKTDIRYVDSYVRAEPDFLVSALNCIVTLFFHVNKADLKDCDSPNVLRNRFPAVNESDLSYRVRIHRFWDTRNSSYL